MLHESLRHSSFELLKTPVVQLTKVRSACRYHQSPTRVIAVVQPEQSQ